MGRARKDANFVSTVIGVSSVDLVTPQNIAVNPETGAVLIDPTNLDSRFVNVTGDTMIGPNSTTFFQIQQADTNTVFNVDTTNARVGIGIASPQELLHVGTGTDASDITATDLLVTRAGPSNLSVRDSTNNVETFLFASSVGGVMGTVTNDPLNIKTNNTSAIFIDASQKVGIGTDSPIRTLDVVGITRISGGGLLVGDVVPGNPANPPEGEVWVMDDDIDVRFILGEGTSSGESAGMKWNSAGNYLSIYHSSVGTGSIVLDSSGNVGIGETTPLARLHVKGSADDQQLIVQAHSTQNANLAEWQDSNSSILSHVNADGSFHFGDASNNLQISAGGTLTLAGTAKKWLAIRPDLDYTVITAQGKPTQVVVGVFHGYSMPVYIAGQNEELFFNIHVPGRWDGASNPIVHLLVALAGAEDVDDNFKFQISWEHLTEGDVIPVTSHDVEVEQAVLTDRNAQYSTYELQFTLDYDVDDPDNLADHDDLAFRLRRIDATNPDVTSDIIVLDYHVEFRVDKMFDGDAV